MRKKITIKDGCCDAEDENDLLNNHAGSETGITGSDVNLLEMIGHLFKYKKIIAAAVLLIMLAATVKVLLTPNVYQSRATILPSGQVDKLSQLKRLAGLGGSQAEGENSSELFPVILRSQLIRDAVLSKTYSFTHKDEKVTITLKDHLGLDNPDALRVQLRDMTSITTDNNGIIKLAATTTYPELSQAVVKEYLAQLENYNMHKRRSGAKENAAYLSRQLDNTKKDLALAEDRLEQFQLVNSDWATGADPTIIKELGRLQREVEVKSQTQLFLMQEHEIARLNIQRDIPIVRVLDGPSLPTLKSGPHRKIIVFLSGMIAFLSTAFVILLLEALGKKKRGPDKESYRYLHNSFSQAFPRTDKVINRIGRLAREKVNA